MEVVDRAFFAQPAVTVAQLLLGKKLVREIKGRRVAGTIVETEAYCNGQTDDLACHASRNGGRPTERTQTMFGPAGHAYVYFTYGLHWLFNVVTNQPGRAGAVLIRALEPLEGELVMAENRAGRRRKQWTNGPAKLTQALAIDGSFDGSDLCTRHSVLWIEDGPPPVGIERGPRVGIGNTPEPWLSLEWRYWIAGNPFVSRFRS